MCHWVEKADTSMVLVVYHWVVANLMVHFWVLSNLVVHYWMVVNLVVHYRIVVNLVVHHCWCWMVIDLVVQGCAVDSQSVERGWLGRRLGCISL